MVCRGRCRTRNNPTAPGAWVCFARQKASSGRRIPTNTTSPSLIWRAAAATMSSAGDKSFPIIDLGGRTRAARPKGFHPVVTKPR
jgi:hypothetical protein